MRCAAVYALGSLYSREITANPEAGAAAAAAVAAAAVAAASAGATPGAEAGGGREGGPFQPAAPPPGQQQQQARIGAVLPPGLGGVAQGGGVGTPMIPMMPMTPMVPIIGRQDGGPGQRQGAPMMGVGGQASAGPGSTDGSGGRRGGMDAWPSLVPDCFPGAAVAGTSETRRLDELDIALRLAKHSGDARCVSATRAVLIRLRLPSSCELGVRGFGRSVIVCRTSRQHDKLVGATYRCCVSISSHLNQGGVFRGLLWSVQYAPCFLFSRRACWSCLPQR